METQALQSPVTRDFHDLHFDSLQILRGIAAVFIVLEHIQFLKCGAFCVDIFFCLSGFMIMFSTHKGTEYFLRKRLIRILPLYYLMTVGTYLLLLFFPGLFAQTKADPVFLLKSLLFIPFDIGDGIIQPLMRVGWTVNCEIFFYLLFMAAFHISRKYRGLLCSVFLLGIVCAAQLLPTDFAPLVFYGDPVMLEFIYGILLYYAARGLYRLYLSGKLPGVCPALGLFGAGLTFLWLLITKPGVNILGVHRPLVWGLPALVIVAGFFLWGLDLKKAPASLTRLGDASFSMYLLHYYPVLFLDRYVFDFASYTPFSLLGVAVAVAVSTLLALAGYFLVEKKFAGCLRKLLLRNRLNQESR